MWQTLLNPVLEIGGKVIDRLWPDPVEREKAKLELMKLAQEGELKDLEVRLSAILAEAQSQDPWTSRARPSFLYVCYALLLASIPMGILSAISPEIAAAIIEGFRNWLSAIPSEIVTLMGIGYLGYAGARSWDKTKIMEGKK
uniref:Putative holin n=1 Tax=viral metagenome TaxID=1070528 RepID=A0A6M3K5I1_9ZZZZ